MDYSHSIHAFAFERKSAENAIVSFGTFEPSRRPVERRPWSAYSRAWRPRLSCSGIIRLT
jgi:hypothetical protein